MNSRRHWRIRVNLVAMAMLFGLAGLANVAVSRPATAACTALPTSKGTATFTVNVPSTTTYRFWAHMYSPSAGNNAVYLQVDSTVCNITVGNSTNMPVGTFTWIGYQGSNPATTISMSLSAGNHTVELAGLDTGVGVDKIMFLTDTSCTPTGDGSNCVGVAATPIPTPTGTPTVTPSPTVVVTPAPGNTPTPGGGTPVSGTINLPLPTTGATRTYYVDGKPVSSGALNTDDLSNGTHTLEIVDTMPDGKTKVTSQKLVVNNAKSLVDRVLAWVKAPVHIAVLVGIIVVVAVGVFALIRLRRFPRTASGAVSLDELAHGTGTAPVVPPQPTDGPPPSQMVYPDKTDPKP